jgi:hypothetical protein
MSAHWGEAGVGLDRRERPDPHETFDSGRASSGRVGNTGRMAPRYQPRSCATSHNSSAVSGSGAGLRRSAISATPLLLRVIGRAPRAEIGAFASAQDLDQGKIDPTVRGRLRDLPSQSSRTRQGECEGRHVEGSPSVCGVQYPSTHHLRTQTCERCWSISTTVSGLHDEGV